MRYTRPRGTQDIVPPDTYVWRYVEGVFDETFLRYRYEPLRTPIFESTDLFLRAVGESTDIVSKEMYTFEDRGGRSLTLRPENTAAVIRAYLDAGMHRQGGVVRLSYSGPMFRYDRPQAGRYRQFHQVGVEAIGDLNPMLDVEVIDLVVSALERLGFQGLVVKVNSVGCSRCRGPYTKELVRELEARRDTLCEDCQKRITTNPLRIFDCKKDETIKRELPAIVNYLCEECSDHFDDVKRLLASLDREFEEDPQLVRGLDYYTKTTFEILHRDLGAQNALCGGGRYDDLVEQCGGPSTPAVGFSAGLERIISVLPAPSGEGGKGGIAPRPAYYIACVGEGVAVRALKAAQTLRPFGSVEVDTTNRALKTQLKSAEKKNARVVVIVDEQSSDSVKWKDMERRTQTEVENQRLSAYADEFSKKGAVEP